MDTFRLNELPLAGNDGLIHLFKKVPDPRSKHGKMHSLHGMLALTYCAFLCGVRGYVGIDDWVKALSEDDMKGFGFGKHGPPSGSIIQKTLRFLDVELIELLFSDWFCKNVSLRDRWIAIDGKTLRGSKHGTSKGLQILSAMLHEQKIILTQVEVSSKTNEIPVAQKMITEMRDIEGAVFTLDAMHTQAETARVIVKEKKAEFVLVVKENQPDLKKSLKNRIFPKLSHVQLKTVATEESRFAGSR